MLFRSVYWAGTAPENHDDLNANDVICASHIGDDPIDGQDPEGEPGAVCRSFGIVNMGLPITLLGAV